MASLKNAKQMGAALRARRKALGLTQTAAAERIGATQRWVSQVENGKDRAEIGAVLRLAEALSLSVAADLSEDALNDAAPRPGKAARLKAGYRAYVDAYRAAMRAACASAQGAVAPAEVRAVSADARQSALAIWAGAKLSADHAKQIRPALREAARS